MPSDDAQLLTRWRDGDAKAGEALFERYFPTVERFFINKVSEGVDDLVQETFLACVKNSDRVDDSSKFRSYLFSIAYNVLRTHLRNRYRAGGQVDIDAVTLHDLDPGPSPCSVAAHRAEQRRLLDAMRQLPIVHQLILELHYWESCTTEEIAEVLDVPLGTIRGRLQRGRELVKKHLADGMQAPDAEDSIREQFDEWVQSCQRHVRSNELAARHNEG